MKKYLIAAVMAVMLALALFYSRHPLTTRVRIRNQDIFVDVAVTEDEKELGLGGRTTMPADRGMLFVYDRKEQHLFWMKGMRFPLDFIWIDDNKVADITKNVPPPTGAEFQLPTYTANKPIDKILEVNAGTVDRLGIRVGDEVKFLF